MFGAAQVIRIQFFKSEFIFQRCINNLKDGDQVLHIKLLLYINYKNYIKLY